MSLETPERRRHKRQAYSDIVVFRVNPPFALKTMVGASIDLSESGLCMFTFDRLKTGDRVEIVSALPVPHSKATVSWTDVAYRHMCKVGIAFTE